MRGCALVSSSGGGDFEALAIKDPAAMAYLERDQTKISLLQITAGPPPSSFWVFELLARHVCQGCAPMPADAAPSMDRASLC